VPPATVQFLYHDFNRSTHLNADTRRHGVASVRTDPAGGVYLWGEFGCSKTRATVQDALHDYLGGRELIQWQEFE